MLSFRLDVKKKNYMCGISYQMNDSLLKKWNVNKTRYSYQNYNINIYLNSRFISDLPARGVTCRNTIT